MTEIALHDPSAVLAQQMRYAETVSAASMLPSHYRGKPADVLLAIGLGASMGLSPAESLYRIDVIQGTPTAGAELIASNVRRAGHTLRVRVDEQGQRVQAVIIRRDDPDFEHVVVRDMAWAQQMGLTSKANYKSQPLTMLQWRAITAVARLACPEALYGVDYTADELDDMTVRRGPSRPAASRPSVSVAAFAQPAEVDEQPVDEQPVDEVTGEVLDAEEAS